MGDTMSRPQFLCFLALLSITMVGCQSFSSNRLGLFSAPGRENPADAPSDPWINDAGTIARTEHPAEEINDPLKLRNIFMSQQARDIERNLGVGP